VSGAAAGGAVQPRFGTEGVRGLAHGKLTPAYAMARKLEIYAGPDPRHIAQQPEVLAIGPARARG
jgi:hypothetical protein